MGKAAVMAKDFVGKHQVHGMVGQELAADLEPRRQFPICHGKFRHLLAKPVFVQIAFQDVHRQIPKNGHVACPLADLSPT